jgi:hypothetical protein
MSSVKSGNWTDPTVWSCNRLPDAGDAVTISASHTVTIPANTLAKAYSLKQEGTLVYASPSATLQLGFTLTTGLIAYYPFNGNANDESGNGHHGVVNGATLTTDRFGNTDKAYSFNGYHWIKVPQSASFQVNDFTLSAWVNLGNSSWSWTNMIIANPANQRPEDAWHYGVKNGASLLEGYIYPGNYLYKTVNPASIQNNWHQVIYTKSGDTAKLFLDGVVQSSHSVPVTILYDNPRGILIGADDDFGSDGIADNWFFYGKIDDVRIYGRGLSDSEIMHLYNLEAN